MADMPLEVLVVAPAGHPSLTALPTALPNATVIVIHTAEALAALPAPTTEYAVVWVVPAPASLLEAALQRSPVDSPTTGCRWLHSFSAGVDGITEVVRRHAGGGGTVTNGRSAFSASLAEYVLAAALHFNKRVETLQANKASRTWDKFVMPTLQGKTMGLLGFGDLAKHTARAAKTAFGMRIITVRRNAAKSHGDGADLVDATLDLATQKLELFAQSDFVVCVLPGTADTEDFVGAAELAAMRRTAVFISIGRGSCVDEAALAAALHAGTIAGAAMDVFKTEPLPEHSALWDCPNLLMSSHNADLTQDYYELGWDVWRKNLDAFLQGSPLVTPVDPAAGY